MRVTSNQSNINTVFSKFFYAIIVFSSAMLATWTLGELLSVGGFTAIEMTWLVIFSSIVLKIADVFWNAVINLAEQMFRIEPLEMKKASQ